jgi:predicted phosphodiesterase
MRILCMADIHGHADALEQVLAFGRAQRCTNVLVAGDLCFPGPEPLRTWKLLMNARAVCVRGVTDLALASVDPDTLSPANDAEAARVDLLRNSRAALGDVILSRLARLPTTFRMTLEDGGELLLVHGSPADPTTPLTHDMSDDEIRALLEDESADLIICGASHVPFDRMVGVSRIVGVGSVGESPSGPLAYAVLLETSNAGVEVRRVAIPRTQSGRC